MTVGGRETRDLTQRGSQGDVRAETLRVGVGAEARDIAVLVRSGRRPPVVWLGGFRSDMQATKARALDQWAQARGRGLVRFDYTGHGQSGGAFADATLSTWIADAEAVLDAFAGAGPILVGSSMGAWVACVIARRRAGQGVGQGAGQDPRAPQGLVLIAPALDFTEDLMWTQFTPEIRAALLRDRVWHRHTDYAPEPDPISLALIEDGRRHRLLGGPIETGCPVHIVQGLRDPDVPYAHALRTAQRLPPERTVVTLIADGDHRLSRPQDIARILQALDGVSSTSQDSEDRAPASA